MGRVKYIMACEQEATDITGPNPAVKQSEAAAPENRFWVLGKGSRLICSFCTFVHLNPRRKMRKFTILRFRSTFKEMCNLTQITFPESFEDELEK